MTKKGFENALRARLAERGLAEDEIRRSLDFYGEMIADRMEDGMSEEEAVAALGEMDAIVREILMDVPLTTLVKQKIKPKRSLTGGEVAILIVLAILGFPIWFSLLVGLFCVVIGVYAVILSLIIVAVCVVFAIFVCGLGLIVSGFLLLPFSSAGGFALFGSAFLLIGIAILMYFPAKYIVIGLWKLTALVLRGIKSLFVDKKKETEVPV